MPGFSAKSSTCTYNAVLLKEFISATIEETSNNPSAVTSETAGWTARVCGAGDWSGSLNYLQDDFAAQPPRKGDEVALIINDGNYTYSGDIVVDRVRYGPIDRGGEFVRISLTFSGNGALAIA